MDSAIPPPSTPGGGEQKQREGSAGDIKNSIAALRSILMIDTPTKSLLSTEHPSIAAQQSRYENRKQQWQELTKLRNSSSELKQKVEEVTNAALLETRKRKTLQATYEALAKHKNDLSVQLQLVTKSREATEAKLANMRKSLNEERIAMAKERVQWKPEMNRLTQEKVKFETKSKEMELRAALAERKVEELGHRVTRLEKELSDAKTEVEANRTAQTAWQPRVDQSEKARRKAEECLAQVQNELDTIKLRHHKSLTSMLAMQQRVKNDLKEAQEGKKVAEEKLQEALRALEEAKKLEKDGDAEQMTTADAMGSKLSSNVFAYQKIERLMNMEDSEDRQARVEEEFDRVRKEQQQRLSAALAGPPPDHERDVKKSDVPSSMITLDRLIRDAIKVGEKQPSFDFVQQLARGVADVKADVLRIQSAKEKAEAKFNAAAVVDEDMEYELASSRERLREARDQLLDSREEAEQLRAELASLRMQFEKMSGTKRTFNGRCESEDDEGGDGDEDDFRSNDYKRKRGD